MPLESPAFRDYLCRQGQPSIFLEKWGQTWKSGDKSGLEQSPHSAWPLGTLQEWGREMQVFLEALQLLAGDSKAGTFGALHITDINKQGTEKHCVQFREKSTALVSRIHSKLGRTECALK